MSGLDPKKLKLQTHAGLLFFNQPYQVGKWMDAAKNSVEELINKAILENSLEKAANALPVNVRPAVVPVSTNKRSLG